MRPKTFTTARRLALASCVAALLVAPSAYGQSAPPAGECQEATVVAPVEADAWVDLNSPLANKGTDALLDVSGDARALVRFRLPSEVPAGCVVESARLRLYADSGAEGFRVEAVPVARPWSEMAVNWENQPGTAGEAVSAWSIDGYMTWNVTAHVREMIGGVNNGWLIRDRFDGTDLAGGHGFYAREKSEFPPQVVIRFASPPTGEPQPPEPPAPAQVTCGQLVKRSIRLTNNLANCPGDGLVIGAERIIVDLDGHTIDGVGLGDGIQNEGYGGVVIRDGTVTEFDHGVQLLAETAGGLVENLTLQHNEVSGITLFDARDGNLLRGNTLLENGGGLLLLSGTTGATVENNTLTLNSGGALELRDADRNRLEGNHVVGGGDLGIGLERSTGNVLVGNVVSGTSDGGIDVQLGSHGNRVEGNTVTETGDTGILVKESDRNEVVGNSTHGMSDAGISLEAANDGLVVDNDLGANPGGLQVDGSSRNLVSGNVAVGGAGIGIELGGGSYANTVTQNTTNANGANGIYIADEALIDPFGLDPSNVISHNVANGNGSNGITLAKGGHVVTGNETRENRSWGINAGPGTIDGGRNAASLNGQAAQCSGVFCKGEWNPPETEIDEHPPEFTRSGSATFAFSADDDTTPPSDLRFECRLYRDEPSAFAACTSPQTYTELTTGTYTFEVRATDRLGNMDEPETFTWSIDNTPPETRIDSGPAELTRETSASFEFSSNEPGSTFECALGDGAFAACTDYSDLGDGEHTFRVRATDRAGNVDESPASYGWTIDTTAPETTIDSGPADPTNETSASFSFSSNEAGSTFECSVDEAEFGACETEYSDLAEGEHTFRVRATDRAGNVDESPASHGWTIDTTAPETTIDSGPADPTNKTSASFEFSSNEAGSTFECSLDAAEFGACQTDYSDLSEGDHTFRVRATDRAGNVDESPASYTWVVDLTAPETSIGDRPADPTNSTTAGFSFSSDEAGSTFECSLDAAEFGACQTDYSDLSEGDHTFRVRATDRAGNVDESPASYGWTIDTTAPETSIDSGPADPTNKTGASFSLSSNEAGSTFECSLDGAPFEACVSGYSDLAEGSHELRARATDRAGNTDPTPASYTWVVDLTAPETTIDSGPADPTNETSASFSFSSNEAGSTFECSLDAAEFGACETEYRDLAEGEHTFRVRATDRAGNVEESPAGYTWVVDLTAPETTIDSGPADPTNQTSASFEFSSKESSTFECSLDEAEFDACESDYSDLAEGEHTFRVRATDRAGNVDESSASYTWLVDLTAPETTIDSGPADPTNSTSASFSFSSNEAGSSFECSLDEAEFGACESDYSDLAEGGHTFRVRAIDRAGNVDGSPASYGWTIDVTAPETAIDSGPADPTNSTGASFEFSSNEAGSTFECSLDEAEFGACQSEYNDLAEGDHTFRVRATDRAGNTDPTPAGYGWTIDVTAPETTIDSGPESPTTDTTSTFEFSADESSTFECSLDDAEFGACETEYSGLAEGDHRFRVRATDRAGNTDSTPAVHEWEIRRDDPTDTRPPETSIGDRPADPTNSTTATFTFASDEAGSTFECSLDQAVFATCTSPPTYGGLADGQHTFRVRATDAAGNTDDSPASYSWTIDTIAPDTRIDTGPNALSGSRSATFTFSSEAGATFECSLDNASFISCGSPQGYGDLADGSHSFRVRATDRAGNTDVSAASYSWTVDATAPQTTIDNGPPARTTSTSATFNFSSEPGATFECALDNGAFAACASPRSYTGLAAGTHTFRVRARDAAGNVDDTPATHTWTIDNVAPQTTIDSGPPARINTGSATFTFSANEAATFECSLDNAAFTACTSPRTYTGLGAGTHTFRVRARDLAGNLDGTPAAQSWVIDTTEPQTTISQGPPAQSTSPNASFSFTSETGATFECSLDNAAFTACASPRQYSGLGNGSHTFRVRARDVAGNVDSTPASQTWTITLAGPCAPTTLAAAADAWIDENSPTSNKGSDSVLKVQSKGPRDNFRALLRFSLPAVPQGCVVDSATLRLYSASAKTPRTLQALRIASAWSENLVNWSNQPSTTGTAATAAAGTGYREWTVTSQVQAMYSDANHGFLIRDAVEGQDAEQQFHSREKGENPPQLVVRFAAAAP